MTDSTKTILAVIALVAAVLLAVVGDRQARSSAGAQPVAVATEYESSASKIEAFVMSKRYVKDRLKAPVSAQFPAYSDQGVLVFSGSEPGVYVVSAWVDAPNGFGVMLRQHYTCKLRDKSEGRWLLESLKIGHE